MSPKSKAQNELIREKSRAAIKQAALELFGTYGYHSTSIGQIAKEAGVSKGLMYNYFNGKEALLQAIVNEAVVENENWWNEIMDSPTPPFEKLRDMTYMAIAVVKSNLHYWQLLTSLAFQPDVMESLGPSFQEKQQHYLLASAGLFRELGMADPEKEAMLFGAIMDGIVLHYMNFGDQYPLDEMKDYMLERYRPK